ncbi:glycosyltransferase family 1 protein [Paenibacillus sp. H1-7]|uniref:glycosyltransferase family 4 protein n=1 Tax=Paenibacillus sp. H1-7 TaxID=2282849 RepID=UPI001EF8741D|nr:glycosyltransferase family 4 protein [Paenibacillus sp. H1-7]ULL19041.1 glycosyltransferase family 1 protein [Paenibacillus sp. H1-7]
MSAKIKVCHISEATSGGVLKHLDQLANYINKDRFEQSFILSPIKNPSLRDKKLFFGNELITIDMTRDISPINDLISLIRIIFFLKKNKFDIIHCHSSKAGVLGRIAGFLTGHKKNVYTPHAFSFNDFNSKIKNLMFSSIERMMSFFSSTIVCVSWGEYHQAIKFRITNSNKLVVIPNGINEVKSTAIMKKDEWLQSIGCNGLEKVIVFSGRFSLQKNPELFVRAINEMKGSGFVAIMLGNGPLFDRISEMIKTLQLEDKIRLLGEVSNVDDYLRISDVFVNVSLWESMPYAILEAMAVEVPVIATDISGTTDLVKDGVTGLLVDPQNHIALKDALELLIHDNEKREKYSQNAKKLIQEHYTIENMIGQLEMVYQEGS